MDPMNWVKDFAAEAGRLARLQGNCGRVIDRFLKRSVSQGEMEVRLDVPKQWNLLDLACFVALTRTAIEGKRVLEAERPYPAPFVDALSVFPWTSTRMVSFIVRVGDCMGSVNERQMILKGVAQTLDMVADMHWGWLEADEAGWMRDWFLGEGVTPTAEQLAVFDELVRGVYARMEWLPQTMVALANVLNSGVQAAAGEGVDLTVVAAGTQGTGEAEDATWHEAVAA